MTRFRAGLLALILFQAGCSPLVEEGSAVARGDEAFARGDLEEALAEYRLALRQGAGDPQTYARAAHAFLSLRRVDEAREHYKIAIEADSTLADQAVADFVHVAVEEESLGDEFGMASAVRTALEFRPGISLDHLALPLARHYSTTGEYGRALPYYQKTLASLDADSLPQVLFEAAVAYDEVGDCESAVVYFEEYRDHLPAWRRSEVDWRLGNCSFQLARTSRSQGDEEEALRHLEVLLEIGEPRNLLALGYFEKGEVLGLRGECEAAIEAFREVPVVDPAGTSPLVARAEERIDQIRFGRPLGRAFLPENTRDDPVSCFPVGSGGRPRTRRGRG
ncbi:tetratricopeptide repeat protein [Gemmatimonadota bacterium]